MSDKLKDELNEKKLSVLESLSKATDDAKLRWRHVAEDSYETNYRSLGFSLYLDTNYDLILEVSKLVPQRNTWEIIMRFNTESRSIPSRHKQLIKDIWNYITSVYESEQADEVLETLTQI